MGCCKPSSAEKINAASPAGCGCTGKSAARKNAPCCGGPANENLVYRKVAATGHIATPVGNIPVISTAWSVLDHLGEIMVRFDINRMDYAIAPGLYAVGKPDSESPVLVSANYKLTFDVLRAELKGLNVWLLIIDTKGVNVWCAAGKGTFGTDEIVNRVKLTGLDKVVSVKQLILPQLGAPGVAAHLVQANCGFKVLYGPVRAHDIGAYLAAGFKADADMRQVTFTASERLTVAWLELVLAFGKTVLLSGLIYLACFTLSGFSFGGAWLKARLIIGLLWSAVLSGTIFTALLLPYLPGKAFSVKGGVLAAAVTLAALAMAGVPLFTLKAVGLILFMTAIAAYLALNYTGATTFTSISGVKKELRIALPCIGGMLICSAVMLFMALF